MRKLSIAIAAAAGFAATPALACSMMNQASATTGSTSASAMMCGAAPAQAQATPGQAVPTPAPNASTAGGCPCCRNMAMMQPRPGQPGGMGNMPGMQHDMQGAPPAPEAAKPN